jgi:hypothetical protein
MEASPKAAVAMVEWERMFDLRIVCELLMMKLVRRCRNRQLRMLLLFVYVFQSRSRLLIYQVKIPK